MHSFIFIAKERQQTVHHFIIITRLILNTSIEISTFYFIFSYYLYKKNKELFTKNI